MFVLLTSRRSADSLLSMPSIHELILPDINASTTLQERTEICVGLRKAGWTRQQAEAATGLACTFDDDEGHSVMITELEPCPEKAQ
ncbi:MAG: hypothetical protein ABFS45_23945 [Pseudomonadota bacterium]